MSKLDLNAWKSQRVPGKAKTVTAKEICSGSIPDGTKVSLTQMVVTRSSRRINHAGVVNELALCDASSNGARDASTVYLQLWANSLCGLSEVPTVDDEGLTVLDMQNVQIQTHADKKQLKTTKAETKLKVTVHKF